MSLEKQWWLLLASQATNLKALKIQSVFADHREIKIENDDVKITGKKFWKLEIKQEAIYH